MNRGREQQLSRSEPPSGSSPNPSNIRSFELTVDIEPMMWANGQRWRCVPPRTSAIASDRREHLWLDSDTTKISNNDKTQLRTPQSTKGFRCVSHPVSKYKPQWRNAWEANETMLRMVATQQSTQIGQQLPRGTKDDLSKIKPSNNSSNAIRCCVTAGADTHRAAEMRTG